MTNLFLASPASGHDETRVISAQTFLASLDFCNEVAAKQAQGHFLLLAKSKPGQFFGGSFYPKLPSQFLPLVVINIISIIDLIEKTTNNPGQIPDASGTKRVLFSARSNH